MGHTVGYHIKNKTAHTHREHATMHAQQANRLPLLADCMLLSVCRCCMLLQCMRCACASPPGTPLLRCPAQPSPCAAHVLLNVVEATVHRHEGGDLLAVLDQLHTGALTNSGVGLLGLNTAAHMRASRKNRVSTEPNTAAAGAATPLLFLHAHLLQHDALGVRGAGEGLLVLAAIGAWTWRDDQPSVAGRRSADGCHAHACNLMASRRAHLPRWLLL